MAGGGSEGKKGPIGGWLRQIPARRRLERDVEVDRTMEYGGRPHTSSLNARSLVLIHVNVHLLKIGLRTFIILQYETSSFVLVL